MEDERLTMGGDCGMCGAEDVDINEDGLCEQCWLESKGRPDELDNWVHDPEMEDR